jgi:hypothetical protein
MKTLFAIALVHHISTNNKIISVTYWNIPYAKKFYYTVWAAMKAFAMILDKCGDAG